MPVVGFLNPTTPEALTEPMRGLRQGLKDAGYVEGENLTIEYRWADNQAERLPAMATELVRTVDDSIAWRVLNPEILHKHDVV